MYVMDIVIAIIKFIRADSSNQSSIRVGMLGAWACLASVFIGAGRHMVGMIDRWIQAGCAVLLLARVHRI